MDNVFIYALVDPVTEEIRYIGKAENCETRLRSHIRASRRADFYCSRWIRSLITEPKLIILDTVPKNNWQFFECAYIKLYRELGFRLTNTSNGGESPMEGRKHRPESNIKRSKSLIGKPAWNKGLKMPDGFGQNIRDRLHKMGHPMQGKKHSVSAILKMSGENNPMFGRTGESHPLFGKTHSIEHRAKNSAAHSGKNHPLYGKKHSPETIEKMRASASARRKVVS